MARYARPFTVLQALLILSLFFITGSIVENPGVTARADQPKAKATPTPKAATTPSQGEGTKSPTSQRADSDVQDLNDAAADARGQTASTLSASAITFVQITDAHLFDSGKHRKTREEGMEEQQDAFRAFHWAMETINAITDSGTEVEFVVFTGDFGLEFVRDEGEKLCVPEKEKEPGKSEYFVAKSKGWPRFYRPAEASDEVAREFSVLKKVKTIYVLPGNNDLIEENPCDMPRYTTFVNQVGQKMRSGGPQIVDLANHSISLPSVGPFQLVGLNSASFKKLKNYGAYCGEDGTALPPSPQKQPGCPRYELELLDGFAQRNASYLVFTHVPDLMDPFAAWQKPAECLPRDSYKQTPCDPWNFESTGIRSIWNNVVASPNVAAIFAGHFHDANRKDYGVPGNETMLYNGEKAASKTWVAPSLALKFQDTQCVTCRARGLLLVRAQQMADKTGVAVNTFWYTGELHGCGCVIPCRVLWGLEIVVVIFLLILVWLAVSRQGKETTLRIRGWVLILVILMIIITITIVLVCYTDALKIWNPVIPGWALIIAAFLVWAEVSVRARLTKRRLMYWLLTPAPLTLMLALAIFFLTRELLDYITSTLNVPNYYCLVVIFGAIGGFVGSISANKGLVLSIYSPGKRPKLTLEVLEDVLIGMGGATVVAFVFDNVIQVVETSRHQMMLLLGVSFVAGVVGRNLVQIASDKLLHRVADEAAEKALQKTKSPNPSTGDSHLPPGDSSGSGSSTEGSNRKI